MTTLSKLALALLSALLLLAAVVIFAVFMFGDVPDPTDFWALVCLALGALGFLAAALSKAG